MTRTTMEEAMRNEAIAHGSRLERHGVRFAFIDPEIIALEYWTTQDLLDEWISAEKALLDEMDEFLLRNYGSKPTRDPNDILDDARRAAWAMNEMEMHFMMDHTEAEYAVYAKVVQEFQEELRRSLFKFVHAVDGDSEIVRDRLYWFCVDCHRDVQSTEAPTGEPIYVD